MKARIKATGEYIEVEQRGPTFINMNDGSLYNVEELDLNVVDDMMSEQEKWYWKDKHIQAAIAAMQGMLSSKETMTSITEKAKEHNISVPEALAMLSVGDADALIAELQKRK